MIPPKCRMAPRVCHDRDMRASPFGLDTTIIMWFTSKRRTLIVSGQTPAGTTGAGLCAAGQLADPLLTLAALFSYTPHRIPRIGPYLPPKLHCQDPKI